MSENCKALSLLLKGFLLVFLCLAIKLMAGCNKSRQVQWMPSKGVPGKAGNLTFKKPKTKKSQELTEQVKVVALLLSPNMTVR